MNELARRIELTLCRADATRTALAQLCTQARELNVRAVCVTPDRVEQAVALLEDTELKVTALVGFPLGLADADTKRFETEVAVDHGAQEIEVALNLGRLKDGEHDRVLREIRDVAEAADERPVKVALETRLLTRDEIISACHLILDSGAAGLVNSTGLGGQTPDTEDIKLLCEAVGQKFFVKAAGRIGDAATAQALINAGADRLGVLDAIFLGPAGIYSRG